jgi:type IV pilus assembly protein PilV
MVGHACIRAGAARQRGSSMIEVLVTIVIIAFGLLGMAGLQSRMQVSEVEAYQRAQALLLLNDMANRIATNRGLALSYVTASTIGPTTACATDFSGTTMPVVDKREWCNALQGAGETSGTSKLGAMLGGRGCVASLGNGEYLVTVAWQGLLPLSAPVSSVTCGKDSYDGATGSSCVNDMCRRVVTTVVRIAPLT